MPSTQPPAGKCDAVLKLSPARLRALGHVCVLLGCPDGSFICICHKCGYMTQRGQLRNLDKKCEPDKVATHSNPWTKLKKGPHPKKCGVSASVLYPTSGARSPVVLALAAPGAGGLVVLVW
eukprot:9409661-Pyramimonas_sp.AAC.1